MKYKSIKHVHIIIIMTREATGFRIQCNGSCGQHVFKPKLATNASVGGRWAVVNNMNDDQ